MEGEQEGGPCQSQPCLSLDLDFSLQDYVTTNRCLARPWGLLLCCSLQLTSWEGARSPGLP